MLEKELIYLKETLFITLNELEIKHNFNSVLRCNNWFNEILRIYFINLKFFRVEGEKFLTFPEGVADPGDQKKNAPHFSFYLPDLPFREL